MKNFALISAAAALAVLALAWWRDAAREEEIAALRAQWSAIASPATAPIPRGTPAPDTPAPQRPESSDAFEARIADLERVASGQADIIEELLRRLDTFEQTQRKSSAASWSALQATGAPDTLQDGDHVSAWAPAQADGGEEWLEAEFANATALSQVIVRETCGPGCITKIVALLPGGAEALVWQGEPPKNASPSNTAFPAPANVVTNRVKVYFDTARVPGWNEIDAVELVGSDGSRQWAKSASASSSYGAGSRSRLWDGNLFLSIDRGE
jgi:hypothetical protein